nr:MAG TPA: hypothetical protein [Caudoviricetes sp.]
MFCFILMRNNSCFNFIFRELFRNFASVKMKITCV